ncbi:MAG: energy-coupling factor ABC transporter substrate-binding protein [Anaerovoracaceae bacterium]|jgi:cobalt/nickel transport protein
MTKNTKLVLVLLLIAIVIAVFPLLLITDSEFPGADGQAEDIIAEIAPDYEPWASSIIEPPGGETESLLFALQAAIGAGILSFGFGYLIASKKYQKGA